MSDHPIMNAGYTIVEMVPTLETSKREEGFALGMGPNGMWVTWAYAKDYVARSGPDFFWGHYFPGEREAKADFHRRLAEEFSC